MESLQAQYPEVSVDIHIIEQSSWIRGQPDPQMTSKSNFYKVWTWCISMESLKRLSSYEFFSLIRCSFEWLSKATLQNGFSTQLSFLFTFCNSAVFIRRYCAIRLRIMHQVPRLSCAYSIEYCKSGESTAGAESYRARHYVTLTSPPVACSVT